MRRKSKGDREKVVRRVGKKKDNAVSYTHKIE